ncbi:uncharacterized protein LOC134777279 [Penaeus indicus]|uniref:uncharacterized protein LOC134777279 n=1 Tax=Penaeus indicus TaxID=29960 RepID=UPI00300CEE18
MFILSKYEFPGRSYSSSLSWCSPQPTRGHPTPTTFLRCAIYGGRLRRGVCSSEFQYGVKDGYSGVDFVHGESRDEDETQGSYTVQLPDGRLQKVTYYVDGDDGYFIIAGEAQFPESEESREALAYGYPQ